MFRTYTRGVYTRLRGVNDVLITLPNQEDQHTVFQHPMFLRQKYYLHLLVWLSIPTVSTTVVPSNDYLGLRLQLPLAPRHVPAHIITRTQDIRPLENRAPGGS